ncbi:HEPN domain-containing protein [Glaciimonas sp. GG7]
MTPHDLINKALRAITSAQLLLTDGDAEGACNRAYYSMFDAARFALHVIGETDETTVTKTHSGLISAFSLHLVKTGRLPVEFGKALNQVHRLRLIADYTGDEVTAEKTKWAIEQAVTFIDAIQQFARNVE